MEIYLLAPRLARAKTINTIATTATMATIATNTNISSERKATTRLNANNKTMLNTTTTAINPIAKPGSMLFHLQNKKEKRLRGSRSMTLFRNRLPHLGRILVGKNIKIGKKSRKKNKPQSVILNQPNIFGVVFVLSSILGSKLVWFRQA